MHFCTAKVMVAGDKDQVVYRDEYAPISWPESELLRSIHGDDAVLDLKPFVRIEQSQRDERQRLVLRYGREYVDACFPGRGGNLMMDAPEADIAYGRIWKNPLTQLEETVEPLPPTGEESQGRKRDAKGAFVKSEANL